MNKRFRTLMLAALLASGGVACDGGPTGPSEDDSFDLGANADMELQVVGDAELAEVMIDDLSLSAGKQTDAAPFGAGRECFREARRLLHEGNGEGARTRARECRMELVRAMLERHGEGALNELFGRVENLVERMGEAGDEFARLGELETRLRLQLQEAYALRDQGDFAAAGERLVLALQIADRMRFGHPDFIRDPEAVVRLSTARGGEAIRLATRLITEPTLTQETVLFRATEMQRRALFSAGQGWYRRAVAQAHRAEQLSLVAVLNAQPPTVDDAQRLLVLAEEMLETAQEAIGDDPTEAQQALLNFALRLKERGAEAISTWHWRGVGLLWRSAVTSAVLIPEDGSTDSA
jgi:hypothetical protein